MKFNVLAGEHHAIVALELDGKGGFAGSITSKDFGNGSMAGSVNSHGHLTGSVTLDGHTAALDASFDEHGIAGKITAGWFFSQRFSGEACS